MKKNFLRGGVSFLFKDVLQAKLMPEAHVAPGCGPEAGAPALGAPQTGGDLLREA